MSNISLGDYISKARSSGDGVIRQSKADMRTGDEQAMVEDVSRRMNVENKLEDYVGFECRRRGIGPDEVCAELRQATGERGNLHALVRLAQLYAIDTPPSRRRE